MNETFNFWLKTDVRFGEGIVQGLPEILQSWKVKRVAVIADANNNATSIRPETT